MLHGPEGCAVVSLYKEDSVASAWPQGLSTAAKNKPRASAVSTQEEARGTQTECPASFEWQHRIRRVPVKDLETD